jgi:hypothetical protein
MSRDQRLALDAMLRKAPQPFGPVPVEQMREGFAAFMATFPIPAGVRRTPTEPAGRPRSSSNRRGMLSQEPSCTFTAAATCSARPKPRCS